MAIDVTVDRWIEQARNEAALMGSEVAGSEHLLLGLLSFEGRASRLLESVGVSLGLARDVSSIGREPSSGVTAENVRVGGLVLEIVSAAEKISTGLVHVGTTDVHLLHVLVTTDQQCCHLLRNLNVSLRELEEKTMRALRLFPQRQVSARELFPEIVQAPSELTWEERSETSSKPVGLDRWFSKDMMKVLKLAQDEADKKSSPICVEDLLRGLRRADGTIGCTLMMQVNACNLEDAARTLEFHESAGELGADVFSPFAMEAIKRSWIEVGAFGDAQLSSAHLLLGIEKCIREKTDSQMGIHRINSGLRLDLIEAYGRFSKSASEKPKEESKSKRKKGEKKGKK